MPMLSVRIDPELLRAAKVAAFERGESLQALVRRAVAAEIAPVPEPASGEEIRARVRQRIEMRQRVDPDARIEVPAAAVRPSSAHRSPPGERDTWHGVPLGPWETYVPGDHQIATPPSSAGRPPPDAAFAMDVGLREVTPAIRSVLSGVRMPSSAVQPACRPCQTCGHGERSHCAGSSGTRCEVCGTCPAWQDGGAAETP